MDRICIKSKRFEQEILIMKRCKQHSNIVSFRGAWIHSDNIWIAMEYCGAGSIYDIMKALKITLTEAQIAIIIRETLYALQYVHNNIKLIHRDIKAANVLLNDVGEVNSSDFGTSYICDATMDKTPY